MRRLAFVAVLAALAAAAFGGEARGASPLQLWGWGTRPVFVDLSGTGSWVATKLRWQTWGSSSAVATGQFGSNLCKPDCAAGKFSYERARFVASTIKTCHGKRAYTKVKVTAPNGKVLFNTDLMNGCP